MQRFRDGKVRRSREEWEQIMDRFHSSGMTGAAFCRKNKLVTSSFENWKKKVGVGSGSISPKPAFVEWPVVAETASSASTSERGLSAGEVELSLPGGVVLRWRS